MRVVKGNVWDSSLANIFVKGNLYKVFSANIYAAPTIESNRGDGFCSNLSAVTN